MHYCLFIRKTANNSIMVYESISDAIVEKNKACIYLLNEEDMTQSRNRGM